MFGGLKKRATLNNNSGSQNESEVAPSRSTTLYEEPSSLVIPAQVKGSNRVGKVATSAWNNPIIQSAVKTLSSLAQIGAGVPFLAPAFVLVQVIIDTEQQASEADAKCNDLIERITFMLGHLSALKDVTVTDMTRQVVDRMNGVLKNAASLIQAYRKQGPVARRLNPNRDKFTSCATTIDTCSNDLMMALQIHQAGQLNILTRSVPIDPEDEAAQNFIADHGGVDAIKRNPELVTQFANQLHLSIDDHVMDQVNTNIADLMQLNQVELGRMLKVNVGDAVIDGFREFAAQMNEVEKEQTLKCVHCDKEYRNSTNGPASCSFHRAEYSTWSKNYPCCSTSHPCQYQSHRARHHCDFPYGAFFRRSYKILNFVDTVEDWATVKDTDLETDASHKASVGCLLRWVSKGQRIEESTILITVGKVWYSDPYFFDTFTVKELEVVAKTVQMTRKALIFRTSPSESEYSMAEWVLSSGGTITGVRVTAKATSSDTPYVKVCPIDVATCTKSGDIINVSEGGLSSHNPDSPYHIPETVRVGPEINDKPLRVSRTDFKTRTSSALPVILKVVSDPPLNANPKFANTETDKFEGVVSVFNKHPAGSPNPISIASITAFSRLVGDEEYLPATDLQILDGSLLPVTIDPRQSWSLKFEVSIPRCEEDVLLGVRWWNRAFVARKRPLRVKLVLRDIEDEECSLVLEYVYTPFPLEKPKSDNLAFFYFDDPNLWIRNYMHVTAGNGSNIVSIDGTILNTHRLEKAVYHALKTGETEVDLNIGREKRDGAWEWAAWALVDLSCRRVYAFKVLLKEGPLVKKKRFAIMGYFLCPGYGKPVNELRPILYARETTTFPVLNPYEVETVVADDTVDDIVPEPSKPPTEAVSPPLSSTQTTIPDDLGRRLASIDSSLSRLATAVEKLVDIFAKTNNI